MLAAAATPASRASPQPGAVAAAACWPRPDPPGVPAGPFRLPPAASVTWFPGTLWRRLQHRQTLKRTDPAAPRPPPAPTNRFATPRRPGATPGPQPLRPALRPPRQGRRLGLPGPSRYQPSSGEAFPCESGTIAPPLCWQHKWPRPHSLPLRLPSDGGSPAPPSGSSGHRPGLSRNRRASLLGCVCGPQDGEG